MEQEACFTEGKTDLHFPFSPHNKTPALALDLFELSPEGASSWQHFWFAKINEYNNDNGVRLRWGGNFVLHSGAGDSDHFEVIPEH